MSTAPASGDPADRDWIDAIAADASLRRGDALPARIDALDRLERFLDFGVPAPDSDAIVPRVPSPEARAAALRDALEAINTATYRTLRAAIRAGRGRDAMLAWAPDADDAPDRSAQRSGDRYDHLDALLGGVFAFSAPDAEIAPLPADMVAYQPTPARAIFDLVARAGITADDVLVDLGSGLGHVPLLVHLCTGARCIGVEREAAYVRCAEDCATRLALAGVRFLAEDARTTDLSAGTVFYLYTPFTGGVLDAVLERLRAEAARRPLRVCSFGPCSTTLADASWLRADGPLATDRLMVFGNRD